MITTEPRVVGLYVAKACPEHWIVRDQEGQLWTVPPGDNSWQRRQPLEPTEEVELEPIPRHYIYMLGLRN
ncbi:MAG: hypothetical protein ACLQIB_47675 [Isosphaeraceae bacterium]